MTSGQWVGLVLVGALVAFAVGACVLATRAI